MKLVDILAAELKVWPGDIEYAHQDYDGEIRFYGGIKKSVDFDFYANELAEDRCLKGNSQTGSRIDRAEWQAAVDALNRAEVSYSAENVSVDVGYVTHTATPISPECRIVSPEWNGEGLPPVGAVVDTDHKNKEIRVKILAHGAHHGGASCVLAADMSHGREGKMFGWMSDQCNFRPIRTAEQVAVEERNKIIREMVAEVTEEPRARHFAFCEALYDAGYRKETKPCGS